MDDRRQAPRFKLQQMVKVTGMAEEEFVPSLGVDLSLKGMRCEIDGCLVDPYERLFLMFDLGEARELKAEGIVMRIDKTEEGRCFIGIEFTDLDSRTKEVLQTIERNAGELVD